MNDSKHTSSDALASEDRISVQVKNLNLYYDRTVQALDDVNLDIPDRKVTAFIGPSGCGKSTLLRCFNRMNDLIDNCVIEGKILIEGRNIQKKKVDVAELRRQVGMVFQKPNPFPKSIYENVAYGLRIQGVNKRRVLDETVEWALNGAALWDEVKDRLHDNALGLSGGQQQRVAVACRAIKNARASRAAGAAGGIDAAAGGRLVARVLAGRLFRGIGVLAARAVAAGTRRTFSLHCVRARSG